MVFGFDFPGFGSKRRTALKGFDQALTALEVNPAYIDDGMRFLVYKWAEEEESALSAPDPATIDRRLRDAAVLISYCVLGPSETEAVWGSAVCTERRTRFEAALAAGDDENFDVRVIKLILTKGVAAPDVNAAAYLAWSRIHTNPQRRCRARPLTRSLTFATSPPSKQGYRI